MKPVTQIIAAAGVGGSVIIGGLLAGAAIASAQAESPAEETTPTTDARSDGEKSTPPWGDGERPWGDGDMPWGDGERPWGDGDMPWGDGERPWDDGEGPFAGGGFSGFGFGPDGLGLGYDTEDLAAAMGMTPEELSAAFESGQTLPEIAEANGVELGEFFTDQFGGDHAAPWGDGAPPWADQSERD